MFFFFSSFGNTHSRIRVWPVAARCDVGILVSSIRLLDWSNSWVIQFVGFGWCTCRDWENSSSRTRWFCGWFDLWEPEALDTVLLVLSETYFPLAWDSRVGILEVLVWRLLSGIFCYGNSRDCVYALASSLPTCFQGMGCQFSMKLVSNWLQ